MISPFSQHIIMTSSEVTTDESTNWTINTHGPVESKTSQLTIKKETLYPLVNCGYGERWWGHGIWCIIQQDDESIKIESDQFMEEQNEHDFEKVQN